MSGAQSRSAGRRSDARSRQIKTEVLGYRIRQARQAAGLTQAQLAEPNISTAYLSRVESGQRRPSDSLLSVLADRLGLAPRDLLHQSGDNETVVELRLMGTRADWALRRGDASEARQGAKAVRVAADAAGLRAVACHARVTEALAAVLLSDPAAAVDLLEETVAEGGHQDELVRSYATLCSAYLALGDVASATTVGERGLLEVSDLGIAALPEVLELAVAHASALIAGDGRSAAVAVCRTALGGLEAWANVTSPAPHSLADVLVDAYWRASLAEQARGQMEGAWRHAESAMTLLNALHLRKAITDLNDLANQIEEGAALDSSAP